LNSICIIEDSNVKKPNVVHCILIEMIFNILSSEKENWSIYDKKLKVKSQQFAKLKE
jgi:hypothetical protein